MEIRALWRIGDSRTALTCTPLPLILMLWKAAGDGNAGVHAPIGFGGRNGRRGCGHPFPTGTGGLAFA